MFFRKDLTISHTRFARGTPGKLLIGICIAEFNEAGGERRELLFFSSSRRQRSM